MAARECYHCKQMIEAGEAHDCWTTTEENLTRDLPEDLVDAYERLRETACSFGEQRIYASHKSIMFSRKHCYFFVRPKRSVLEVWFFIGRALKHPLVRKVHQSSKAKVCHLVHVKHRDEVEPPVTEWLKEAFDTSDELGRLAREKNRNARPAKKKSSPRKASGKKTAKRKTGKKKTRR